MKIALVGLIMAGAAGSLILQERPRPLDEARTRFLFAAVIEGLAEDGFEPKLAGEISDNARFWFIKKCPICDAVLLALRAYKASCDAWPAKGEAWSGCRVPKETRDDLRSADTKTRHKAFEGLVSRYVENRFERVKMSEDARNLMRESIKIGMKEGLEQLQATKAEEFFPGSCPSCEGAN